MRGLLWSRPYHQLARLRQTELGDRFVTRQSQDTRRSFLSLGLGLAALAVFGCGMSAAASGSGSGGSNSGSSGSGGTSGSSGSGSGSGGSSGPGGGNSGPGSGNSGPGGGDDDAGEKKAGRSNAQNTLRSRGRVVWANVRDDSIEVRYSDGWSEQVTSRRYRLRDPAKRIVIERAAKALDFERLRSAAR